MKLETIDLATYISHYKGWQRIIRILRNTLEDNDILLENAFAEFSQLDSIDVRHKEVNTSGVNSF